MKFYEYSDKRSAKHFITIEQKPEPVQYIESNAARMGVSVQNVVDAMITAQYNSIKSGVRTEKAPMDKTTYELRKQLELAQYRTADDVIEWRGYRFSAGSAAEALKHLNGQFSKPSKKQLLLFEAEIAADAAPIEEQPAAPVEDIEAAVVAHFEDLAAHDTPASEKTDTPSIKNTTTPSRQKKQLAAWNGAVVEVLEICAADNTAIIKLKGGSRTRIPADALEQTTAKKTTLPDWMVPSAVIDVKNAVRVDAPPARHTIESVKASNIYYTDGTYSSINYIMHYGSPAADTPANQKTEPTPANQKPAATDAEVLATAARIRANYEAMQADIEAEREQGRAAFAEAITAYCEELSRPEPLAWEPETIIVPFTPRAAEVEQQPRRRHRLNLRPRLSRWLNPVRWVAMVLVCCVAAGLLIGASGSHAAAEVVAQVVELQAVTVTAEAPQALIEERPQALIEDEPPAPSPVKKLAAPSPVKNVAEAAECSSQKTDAADCPAGEKTASPMATATDAAGLTICEGTPWAYTMMNWA